jgi:poly(A) polymerase
VLKINNTQWSSKTDLLELLTILPNAKIVGGAVRNSIIGIPLSDIDIATDLLPDEVAAIARQNGFTVIPTGIAHGTVTCVKDESYEVTTLRIDKETDGRHAVVEFCDSWEEDAKRRDFTINALYSDFEGNITDFVDGIPDLEQKLIRFIGNPEDRIGEDYLRILRFFRFYAHYCKEYDVTSLEKCAELAPGLKKISRERCTYEFLKILKAPNPWEAVEMMDEAIFEYAGLPKPNSQLISDLRDAEETMQVVSSYFGKAGAFYGIGELMLSRHQTKCITMLQNLQPMHILAQYVLWINTAPEEIIWDGILLKGRANLDVQSALPTWLAHRFPLQGRDLIKLGVQPGPKIKEIIDKSLTWFANQRNPSSLSEIISYIAQENLDEHEGM